MQPFKHYLCVRNYKNLRRKPPYIILKLLCLLTAFTAKFVWEQLQFDSIFRIWKQIQTENVKLKLAEQRYRCQRQDFFGFDFRTIYEKMKDLFCEFNTQEENSNKNYG